MVKSQATNDGEYQATEVVAMSSPIMVSKQRFLQGVVIKRRNGLAQAVNMGDLIAIENKKGRQKKSFLPGRWSIAQVLGFQGTEHVMILHLWHVKEVSKLISNSKFVTEYVRVDNSLAISRQVEPFVEVGRILPISIHLLQEKMYQHGDYLNYICDDLVEEWCYQCHFVLPETMDGSLPAKVKDPVYLQSQSDKLPQSVSDALQLIDIPNIETRKLAKRLAAQYTSPWSIRFQLLQPSTANPTLQPHVTKRKKDKDDESNVRTPARTKKRAKKEAPAILGRTKTSKSPEGGTSSHPASFHVELGPACFQKHIKNSIMLFYDAITLEKSWKIKVGSFVAANAKDRRDAPAQVLSIYRKKDENNVFLEVRWFYRISELPPQQVLPTGLQKDEIIEVDEDVFQVEPANLVRPLRLSSQLKKRPKDTLLCRFAFSIRHFSFGSSDTLIPITHWSGQDSTRIGIDCPKGFPGKIPELLQSYGGSEAASISTDGKVCNTWSEFELSRVGNVSAGTVIVKAPDGTSYFDSIEWRPLAVRFTSGFTSKRLCKARIGDAVCIMEETEGIMCEPFVGPWRLVQILAIYRKPGERMLHLEVRRCLRSSDLPSSVQMWSPKMQLNEYFESDIVECHVMASRLLAPAKVIFKKNHDQYRSFEESGIQVLCPFFFSSKVLRIQSLISHEAEAFQKSWFVQRGICHSDIVREVDGLKAGIQFCIPSPLTGVHSISSASSGLSDGMTFTLQDPDTDQDTILSCFFRPRWDKVLDCSCLLPRNDEARWRCRIGDVVAVEESTATSGTVSRQWPFTVNWRPAQVLAFSETLQGTSEVMQVRLRFFQFQVEQDHSNEGCLPSVFSSTETEIDPNWVNSSSLLGPILLIPSVQDVPRYKNPWGWWYPFVPTNAVVYSSITEPLGSVFENGIKMLLQHCCSTKEKFHRVVRGLVESDRFAGDGVQLPLICALDRLNEKQNVEANKIVPLTDAPTVRTIGLPLYKDGNSSYFEEISVEVPSTLFTRNLTTDSLESDDMTKRFIWIARIGDPVILRYDTAKSRRQPFVYWSSRDISGPFVVPAAVGEIVTIRKEIRERIMLEIRWFFRESEVSGSSRSDDLTCEEILESDLFDDVVADRLIAPVRLHSQPRELTQDLSIEGIPLLEFYCNRFWSVKRKCSVPVAGLGGRVARGRTKSKRLCGNPTLASALQSLLDNKAVRVEYQEHSENWQIAFEKTISKLSLTDAAKETDCSLAAIVGREVERRKILTFVQDALSGSEDISKCPSLLVSGPPGTGKTATIRAVIRDLQSKLANSCCWQMRFIILNGMETRHPHDIYGMFWDELEASGNGRLSSKEAASKLKKYFTAVETDPERSSELIIVMLDEIDYVMTKGQEVLYDMFDLPLLSMEKKNGKQLLMIGVSNMLNLPDKLHPRVQSRIGCARVFFRSYSVDETKAILVSKVKAASPDYEVFHSDAILYASKKTAAMSGDIRKAFQICKQAAELVLEEAIKSNESKRMVYIKDVVRVSRDSFNSAQSRTVALCTSMEALVIVTLASLSKTTGRESGGFDVEELVTKMASVANSHGESQYLPPPNLEETLVMLRNLGDSNLITLNSPQNASLSYRASLAGSGGAWPLVSLQVEDVSVLLALKDTSHHRLAQKHLGRQ